MHANAQLLPIGGRWMPLVSVHSIVLQEMIEGGLHVRQLNQDGSLGVVLTKEAIRVSHMHLCVDTLFVRETVMVWAMHICLSDSVFLSNYLLS
jgi:hypothetical protein